MAPATSRRSSEVPPYERRSPFPIAISFAIHTGAFFALLGTPGVHLPHATDSEYRQKISGKEQKLVWYKFHRELPAVSPAHAERDRRSARAEALAKQQIVSSPKQAPKREQMVWTPTPKLAPAPPVESPNVLAVKLPDPLPKQFVAPPAVRQPELATPDVPQAPPLAAKADVRMPELGSPLPPKSFTRPRPAVPDARQLQFASDAPQLTVGAGSPVTGLSVRLPARPFTAPSSKGGAPDRASVSIDAPQDLNVAVVGLKPVDTATLLPTLPSPGQFSAGTRLNPNGSTGENAGTGLAVPDLFVGGKRPAAQPGLLAQALAPPTSAENIRAAMRHGEPVMITHVDPKPASPLPPGVAKVSSAPEARFNGRDIYMMAIQLPNLTSNSGSWLMWYSDHALRGQGHGAVSPPVPRRKVDPKYIATAAAERVEGRVQLACVIDRAGRISAVELVRGVDERLDESAKEALAKWEFDPATREGAPVDVDVLVEIPFRLAPRASRR